MRSSFMRLNLRSIGVIEVLPPLLTFRMAWNEGINFGLSRRLGAIWCAGC